MTKISNSWITLSEQRNGVDVQRKFGGLDTRISLEDDVVYCKVFYWERELYPNEEVIKTELKHYVLTDLSASEVEIEGVRFSMEARAVLSGFVQALGNPYIIGPARQTLADMNIFNTSVPDAYPLHRDTRPKTEIK